MCKSIDDHEECARILVRWVIQNQTIESHFTYTFSVLTFCAFCNVPFFKKKRNQNKLNV